MYKQSTTKCRGESYNPISNERINCKNFREAVVFEQGLERWVGVCKREDGIKALWEGLSIAKHRGESSVENKVKGLSKWG
jgi:hypothetical protein